LKAVRFDGRCFDDGADWLLATREKQYNKTAPGYNKDR
jgi:hypothetical protein